MQIVQGKQEAARQAGLPAAGRPPGPSSRAPPPPPRPHTSRRTSVAGRQRRRPVPLPPFPQEEGASFEDAQAMVRASSITSEELLRSSRALRVEMGALRNLAAPLPASSSSQDEEEEGKEEDQLAAAPGAPPTLDPSTRFPAAHPQPAPTLSAEGSFREAPFRLGPFYPPHLYSELSTRTPPLPVYHPTPRPPPQYLATPWSAPMQPPLPLFPWPGPFSCTPGFGLDMGGLPFGGGGTPLGGLDLEGLPPDSPYGAREEASPGEMVPQGDDCDDQQRAQTTQEPRQPEQGGRADLRRAQMGADFGPGAQGGLERGGWHDEKAEEAGRQVVWDSDPMADAAVTADAAGGLQAMPRVAGLDVVEQSLAVLSSRTGGGSGGEGDEVGATGNEGGGGAGEGRAYSGKDGRLDEALDTS
jgi:hypothetical protein